MKKLKTVDRIGETTKMTPFTFREYGARGHRSGSGGAIESNSYVKVVRSEKTQVDQDRSDFIDSVLLKLQASTVRNDDEGLEPEQQHGEQGTTRLRDAA